jgi:hypothetical protein
LEPSLTDTERAILRDLIDAETAELVELAGPLDDPLALERLAMTLAGALCDPMAPAGVPELMVESLESRRGTEGATILAAIGRLGSGPAVSMADAALQRLGQRGIEPKLPNDLGARSLEEALSYAPGDAELYLFRLRRPGDRLVQIGYLAIERHQGGGVLVDGTLSEPLEQNDADPLLHQLGREVGIADLQGRPISAEQLAQTVRDACGRARELDMAVEPELLLALSILGRALGIEADALSLPLARDGSPLQVDPEDEGLFAEVSDSLLGDFENWVEETEKDDGPLHRNGGYVAGSMLHWKWGYDDGDLGWWSREEVEEFLLDYAPRKLDTDEEVTADTPDCVAGFLSFLDQVGVLAGDPLPSLVACSEELRQDFAEAAKDSGNWGVAKSLVAQMQSEGIDPTDRDGMQAWVDDFNSRPREERDQAIGAATPKIGLAVGWFPAADYEEAQERWEELKELWGEIPHAEYCRRFEATLRGWAGEGVKPALADLRLEELLAFCEEHQVEPLDSRDHFAAEKLRHGEVRYWPPGRNEPCWCESGTKYKRCCGTVTAVATHPLDAEV